MLKDILKKKIKIKNKGFTLAEILVTLTIIGIVAAILFPSILANYTERTLAAKRQALVARMSQAMAELADTFRNYEDTENWQKNSAIKFINEGLSKVYKIAAACDYDTLSSCDIPSTITLLDGREFKLIEETETMEKYAPAATCSALSSDSSSRINYCVDENLAPAGLITKNGESILVFFNPRCNGKPTGTNSQAANNLPGICVNMIYDLNGGKQKPNRLNEDIGVISVLYNDQPTVVSPKFATNTTYSATANTGTSNALYKANAANYADAQAACAAMGNNYKIPSMDEMKAIGMNSSLYFDKDIYQAAGGSTQYWTSTVYSSTQNTVVSFTLSQAGPVFGEYQDLTSVLRYVCIQDN